ncbi:MAG: hypothetical protein ACYTAS_12220 [Planctomycetota bacterium]
MTEQRRHLRWYWFLDYQVLPTVLWLTLTAFDELNLFETRVERRIDLAVSVLVLTLWTVVVVAIRLRYGLAKEAQPPVRPIQNVLHVTA